MPWTSGGRAASGNVHFALDSLESNLLVIPSWETHLDFAFAMAAGNLDALFRTSKRVWPTHPKLILLAQVLLLVFQEM